MIKSLEVIPLYYMIVSGIVTQDLFPETNNVIITAYIIAQIPITHKEVTFLGS